MNKLTSLRTSKLILSLKLLFVLTYRFCYLTNIKILIHENNLILYSLTYIIYIMLLFAINTKTKFAFKLVLSSYITNLFSNTYYFFFFC